MLCPFFIEVLLSPRIPFLFHLLYKAVRGHPLIRKKPAYSPRMSPVSLSSLPVNSFIECPSLLHLHMLYRSKNLESPTRSCLWMLLSTPGSQVSSKLAASVKILFMIWDAKSQILIIICISGNVSLGERITVLGADDDRTVNYITSRKWSPFVAQLPVPAAPCSWLQDYIKGFLLVREPQRELFPSPPQDYLTITLDKTSKGLFGCVRTISTILSSSMSAPLKHLPTEGYREVGGVFPARDSAAHVPCPGMDGGRSAAPLPWQDISRLEQLATTYFPTKCWHGLSKVSGNPLCTQNKSHKHQWAGGAHVLSQLSS